VKVQGERIIVFGDSLSHHGADHDPEIWDVDQDSNRVSGQPGDLLASMLLEQGAQAVRVNARVGRSAHNFWGREDANALLSADAQFQPTQVVIFLGTNDIGLNADVDRADMQRIVDFYQGLGADVWGIGPVMYVDQNLNIQANAVSQWMADLFGGKFIDPRTITPVVGRAGDGVHFGADSARQLATALAQALPDSFGISSRGWLGVAVGALVAGGIAYAVWHRSKRAQLQGSLADLEEITPTQSKSARAYLTDAKKALAQLEAKTNSADASLDELKKLADKTYSRLAKAKEAAEESFGDTEDEDAIGLLEELEEIYSPDGEGIVAAEEYLEQDWKSALRNFKKAIANVDQTLAAELDGQQDPPKPKPKRKRKAPEQKALEARREQIFQVMGYAGNTPEQVAKYHEQIAVINAKLQALGNPGALGSASAKRVKLWRKGPITGLWQVARTIDTPADEQAWLEVFKRDEPTVEFKVSKNKPRG
jgi:lysophospholipase L1-like esterase